jgi:hypothetical protein
MAGIGSSVAWALLGMAGTQQRFPRACQPVVMQRHHVSRPHAGVVQRKEGVLEPTAAVHDIRALSLDRAAQGGDRARVRSGRVEGARNVRIKAREILAPTAYADDPHTVNSLLIWEIAGLKRDDNDAVAELDGFYRQGGDMPF